MSPDRRCFAASAQLTIIISAAVVDDLLCRRSLSSTTFISFFFCRDNDAESLHATTILGSLIRACLTADGLTNDVDDALSKLLSEGAVPDASDLVDVFITVSNIAQTHFVVIDGLDECPKQERAAALTVLHHVVARTRSTLKLFLSCRDDDGDDILHVFPNCHRQVMSPAHVGTDIAAFVEDVIQAKIKDEELTVGDPALVADIRKALVDGADGM